MTVIGKLLAMDSAGRSCSVAVWRSGRLAASNFEARERGQSERLVPMIQEAMAAAGMAFRDLDAIAVTTGPGGFTGVRIGLAAARGLGLATARPVIGLTCFEAIAAAVPRDFRGKAPLAVVIDAKRADLYLQVFDPARAAPGEPVSIDPADLPAALPPGQVFVAGDAAEQARPYLDPGRVSFVPGTSHIDASRFAGAVAARPLPPPGSPPPRPLYLRPPDVTLPGRDRTP